jgi:hypothetical protein
LRGNSLARAQVAQIYTNSGITTADELRAIEDMEPLPHGLGSVIMRPMNATAYDTTTGEPVDDGSTPDPELAPPNPAGAQGGGDPNNSPDITKPDQLGQLLVGLEDRRARDTHVTMTAPPVNVESPTVNVAPPDVTVEAAQITVEPQFTVEAARAPDVHVQIPERKLVRRVVNRDDKGLIISVDEIWVDDVPVP